MTPSPIAKLAFAGNGAGRRESFSMKALRLLHLLEFLQLRNAEYGMRNKSNTGRSVISFLVFIPHSKKIQAVPNSLTEPGPFGPSRVGEFALSRMFVTVHRNLSKLRRLK
jgi:hypothetical protein